MKNPSKSLFYRIFFSFFIAVLITAFSPISGNKSFVAYACASNEISFFGVCVPWFVKPTPTPSFVWCGRTGAWELPGNCPPPRATPTTPPVDTGCQPGQVQIAGRCENSGVKEYCPATRREEYPGQCPAPTNPPVNTGCPAGQVQLAGGQCVVEGGGGPTNTPVGNPTTPPASCQTVFQYNECIACRQSRPVYKNSCTQAFSTGSSQSDNACASWCGASSHPTNAPLPTNPPTGGHGTPSNPLPIGYLDQATCNNFGGWTCDTSNFNSSIRVDFYADGPAGTGRGIGSTTASTARSDLGPVCGGNSVHAFNVAPPSWLKDNKRHTIYAYGIGAKGNTLLTNQKQINCSSSTSSLSASITGPTTGIPGRPVGPFTATATGANLEYVRMYYAPKTADLTQASSWTWFGWSDNQHATDNNPNNDCHGTTCTATATIRSLPAGEYYVEVNANDSNKHCSANADRVPAGSGWVDCGDNDKLVLTVSTATPTSIPTPTHGITPTVTRAAGTPTPTTVVSTTPTSADIDKDGCTGAKDLDQWISSYENGTSTQGNTPDINRDGRVDLLDYNYWYLAFTNPATTKCVREIPIGRRQPTGGPDANR